MSRYSPGVKFKLWISLFLILKILFLTGIIFHVQKVDILVSGTAILEKIGQLFLIALKLLKLFFLKNVYRYPELASICKSSNTLILYPGAGATNLEEMDLSSTNSYAIIIIDGTWSQAKDIFLKNSLFQMPKQVRFRILMITVQVLCWKSSLHYLIYLEFCIHTYFFLNLTCLSLPYIRAESLYLIL